MEPVVSVKALEKNVFSEDRSKTKNYNNISIDGS